MNTKTTQKRAVIFMRAREIGAFFGLRDLMIERTMIEWQREQCREAAQQLNAAVVREYEEHGGTGSIHKRPKLRLMLDELRALHDVDYVIVTGRDRLTRRAVDHAQICFELELANAELVIASEIRQRKEVRYEQAQSQ
jgi:DNA invertase Pin-like site-specific DNA recombinase